MLIRTTVAGLMIGIFGLWSSGKEAAVFLVLSVALASLFSEISIGANFEIAGDVRQGSLEGIVMAGRGLLGYAMAQVIWQMGLALIGVSPLLIWLTLQLGVPPVWVAISAFLLLWGGAAVGVLLSGMTIALKTFRYSSLVVSVILLLGGVFYPLSILPVWMQHLGKVNPVWFLIDGSRSAWLSHASSGPQNVLLGGFGVLFLWVVASLFCSRREEQLFLRRG